MSIEKYRLDICHNCALAIANGEPFPEEDEDRDQYLTEYEERIAEKGGYLTVGTGEGDEADIDFSSSRCDTCGELPGGRVVAWEVYPVAR